MVTTGKQQHTAAFKAQVSLAVAGQGGRAVNELASHSGVHPTLIHGWKTQRLAGVEGVLANGARAGALARQAELLKQIGRLKMEPEWVKKGCCLRLRASAR